MIKEKPEPISMTVEDAVQYTGMARSRIYRLLKSGELTSFKLGGRTMLLRATLDSFILNAAASPA